MAYGFFDDPRREYVITNPRTPVKWINYVGNLSFGGFIDHTGGSQLCKGDPALNRITKYIPQLPASDFKGETAYIRVRKPGEPASSAKIDSPYWVPCLGTYEKFECRIGMYYTQWKTRIAGLDFDVLAFVPLGSTQLVRRYTVTNPGTEAVQADLVPVVEFSHFDALKQLTNADWVPQTMQSAALTVKNGRTAIAAYAFMKRDYAVNVFTASLPAESWETDRKRFLGDNEYGTWREPLSLKNEKLSSKDSVRGDIIAALQIPLGTIAPGASATVITGLTQAPSLSKAADHANSFMTNEEIDAAFRDLSAFWDDYLSIFKIETPDPAFNSMLNIHNPRQCYTTKTWSRYLSLYQLGYGSDRGIGFRDSTQDCMGVIPQIPAEARELMEKLMSVQSTDGSAYHQFNPLTMIAGRGDSMEYEDRPHWYSDDALWMVLAVSAYLKETGDYAFLQKTIPFYEKDKAEKPLESGTVLEHLLRAVAFTHDHTGAHGLPLLGFADWNDTVNLPAGAESLFTAHLYGWALREFAELADWLKDSGLSAKLRSWYDEMNKSVNASAWDGDWYVRYFDDKGSPVGSAKNEYGKLWLNGQSWAVLSGFGQGAGQDAAGDGKTPSRGKIAMEAVKKHLATDKGIKLSWPGYNGFDPQKGGVTTYPPGAKENGGIFLHPNPWAIIAETILGDGDQAFAYYQNVNPAAKNDSMDEYECEPYCYAQNILSNEHPNFGLGRNSWLSGTSSWMYQSSTKYILGIQPEHEGLRINPCIPKQWNGFKAERRCRGVVYKISVHNPDGRSKGVRKMLVDGKEARGNLVPWFASGEHTIDVTL
ncbi:glycosyl transferase [Treponema zuelzerae]|uniref:Glycosyl transferase n=1 Tax=Teretinema zuelzerae TaxID=156 RepID=A0AAE3EIV2_9SPIR|nr:glycosyl transferase [Teretinema zuelzerae]MCD1654293.1 glycosyl transferase [Teretinema zuelzerae]